MEEMNLNSDGLAAYESVGSGVMAGLIAFYVIFLILGIIQIVGQWKAFQKAGQPGWAVLVPIYNIIVLFRVAKSPGWWFLMFFVPIANIIFAVKLTHNVSKNFGKDGGFTAGLIFLPWIFWPILGFGSAQYLNESTNDESILDS